MQAVPIGTQGIIASAISYMPPPPLEDPYCADHSLKMFCNEVAGTGAAGLTDSSPDARTFTWGAGVVTAADLMYDDDNNLEFPPAASLPPLTVSSALVSDFNLSNADFSIRIRALIEADTPDVGGSRDAVLIGSGSTSGALSGWWFQIDGASAGSTGEGFTFVTFFPLSGSFKAFTGTFPATMSKNVWYELLFTYEFLTDTPRFYLNGAEINLVASSAGTIPDVGDNFNDPCRIGATGRTDFPRPLVGRMDDVIVTPGVLTETGPYTPSGFSWAKYTCT